MSLSGSLYLFEQLRGNCVTLAGEDVLWRRTRWTEGTGRGSVAIINEGYFPSAFPDCVCVCGWWGNKKGWWAPLPWGNSAVRCTLRSHAPTIIITFFSLNRIVSVRDLCPPPPKKIYEFRCHSQELQMQLLLIVVELNSTTDDSHTRMAQMCVHVLQHHFLEFVRLNMMDEVIWVK